MKTIINQLLVFAVVMFGASSIMAQQTINVPLTKPDKTGTLIVDVIFADEIIVQSHDKKEVTIIYDGDNIRTNKPDTKNGLRRISTGGLTLEVTEKDNIVHINGQPMNDDLELQVFVPKSFSVKITSVNGDVLLDDINGEIEIESVNGDIELSNINGSALITSVHGDIEADFVGINSDAPMSFTGINGDIDIAFPADAKFSAKMKTDFGDVYTDFDMEIERDTQNQQVSQNRREFKVSINKWIIGRVNGGGPEYLLKTLHGDISIRKK